MQQARRQRGQEAIGQHPVGMDDVRPLAHCCAHGGQRAEEEQERSEHDRAEPQGAITLCAAHVAKNVEALRPDVAIRAQIHAVVIWAPGEAHVKGGEHRHLVSLRLHSLAQRLDEGAAEVAVEARVVVGQDEDAHTCSVNNALCLAYSLNWPESCSCSRSSISSSRSVWLTTSSARKPTRKSSSPATIMKMEKVKTGRCWVCWKSQSQSR